MKNRNQMVSDAIRKMVLPEDVEAVINDTDINCIADLFGGMNAEEIVRFVRAELIGAVTKDFDGYGELAWLEPDEFFGGDWTIFEGNAKADDGEMYTIVLSGDKTDVRFTIV